MTWPTATLTETYVGATGGTVTFVPVPVQTDITGERLAVGYVAAVDSAGHLSVTLPVNEGPTIDPLDGGYRVLEELQPHPAKNPAYMIRVLAADAGQTVPLSTRIVTRGAPGGVPGTAYTPLSLFYLHLQDIAALGHLAHVKPDGVTIFADPDGTLHAVGGGSGGDAHYVHLQNSPALIWTINHNLNKHPAVTVVDSAGTEFIAQIEYPTLNQAIARMTAAFSGTAYCN